MPELFSYELKAEAKKSLKLASPTVYLLTILYMFLNYGLNSLTNSVTVKVESLWNLQTLISSPLSRVLLMFNNSIWGNQFFTPKLLITVGLLALLAQLLSPLFSFGYEWYCLGISRREERGYGDLFEGIRRFGKVLWLSIVMGVIVFLWFLLLIIPGVVAILRYRMAFYILMDHPEYSAMECLRASKEMMQGRKLWMFGLGLTFFGWFLLSVFTFGILTIWLTPYMSVTYANVYNEISKNFPGNSNYTELPM